MRALTVLKGRRSLEHGYTSSSKYSACFVYLFLYHLVACLRFELTEVLLIDVCPSPHWQGGFVICSLNTCSGPQWSESGTDGGFPLMIVSQKSNG